MGGDGYSDLDDFEVLFNVDYSTAQLTLWNKLIARKINKKVTGYSTTDVTDTLAARVISDQLMMISINYLKESSSTEPPEFIHYKLPHFTPDMLEDLATMALEETSRGVV
jgi:hypothetical protein